MTDTQFTDPDVSRDEWVDVRMQDPDAGEWDIDAVVAEGRVEYVDLRVKPDFLTGFIDCLIDDVGQRRGGRILHAVADRNGIDLSNADVEDLSDADVEDDAA